MSNATAKSLAKLGLVHAYEYGSSSGVAHAHDVSKLNLKAGGEDGGG